MSNYIEHDGTITFHPGYYIEEIIEELGITQKDLAERLGTTPKNISKLVNGSQSLSVEMADKLSRMLGTSTMYWLNIQNSYDIAILNMKYESELACEVVILQQLGYKYFRDNFKLPDIPRKLKEQVAEVREFLQISSLKLLESRDSTTSYRSSEQFDNVSRRVKANAMVQIAVNEALREDIPKFDRSKFEEAIEYSLNQTTNHEGFYPLIYKAFLAAGVFLSVLPNIEGSKTNGATKKIGDSVLLMVNDRCLNADTFWFTLMHEAGHILNNDFGVSFEHEAGMREDKADNYAANILIPPDAYSEFCKERNRDLADIIKFAKQINRDPGIVVGRLQNDGLADYNDKKLAALRTKYKVKPTAA